MISANLANNKVLMFRTEVAKAPEAAKQLRRKLVSLEGRKREEREKAEEKEIQKGGQETRRGRG